MVRKAAVIDLAAIRHNIRPLKDHNHRRAAYALRYDRERFGPALVNDRRSQAGPMHRARLSMRPSGRPTPFAVKSGRPELIDEWA